MTRAVVFAYHNVGVRCLAVLLAHGIEVPLVVTHDDAPGENIWFESVASLARLQGVEAVAPADPNAPGLVARLSTLRPEFLFSFYYRHMLSPAVLATASRGAFNMHGSLLPKYRGRVPVNWAIVHGERETGATLHEMVEKPDAGRIVDQQAVPILPNDTARDVFGKVTVAAEVVLDRSVPRLMAGTAALRAQNLSQGSYFGGRKPADGRIDPTRDAWSVHNLVRAVAPPYPGAFTLVAGAELRILRTFWNGRRDATLDQPSLFVHAGALWLRCADGGVLRVLEAELAGEPLDAENLPSRFPSGAILLT
jgi:methionyl-tRNA formyltransferase